jgi:GTPase SAR1 family protein
MAGQERFGNMMRVYCKGADAAIIVFDVLQEKTLEAAVQWKQKLDSFLAPGCPVILLANKLDLLEGEPDTSKLDKFIEENHIDAW